ncbi:MAG: hypothetical protein CL862_00030 [Cyanobium sp. NAT70]|nr:hypothetical protein [Cyanobium sp. NAT70]
MVYFKRSNQCKTAPKSDRPCFASADNHCDNGPLNGQEQPGKVPRNESQLSQDETAQEFLGQFRGCTIAQRLYDGVVDSGLMLMLPSSSQQDSQRWSGHQLKQLLERSPNRDWAHTSALMEAHEIKMCRRSTTR